MFRSQSFWKKNSKLMTLMALFALGGMATLVATFAAVPTQRFEAESFSYDVNQPATVPAGASYASMWWTSTGTKTVLLDRDYKKMSVIARGQQCYGLPRMQVKIDQNIVLDTYVDKTEFTEYPISLNNVTGGQHTLQVSFLNDGAVAATKTAPRCDRNLYVDAVTFTGSNDILEPTTEMKDTVLTTALATDFQYGKYGRAESENKGILWSNGTISATKTTTREVSNTVLYLAADKCNGEPVVRISLNGKVLREGAISSTAIQPYVISSVQPAGSQTIQISLLNDMGNSTCNRNIRLEKVEFRGYIPPVPPKPTGTVYFEPVYSSSTNNLTGSSTLKVNNIPSAWVGEQEAKASNLRSVVSGLPGSGSYKPSSALVATIEPKEITMNSDGPYRRSEVHRDIQSEDATEGAVRWIDFSVYIPADFQTSEDNGYIDIWQWKGRGTSSPPVAIGMHTGDDKPYWYIDSDNPPLGPDLKIGYVEKGKWSRITLGVKFSHDPKLGWLEARFNDKQVSLDGATRYTRQTMQNKFVDKNGKTQPADTGMYAKMGLYTSKAWEDTKQQAYFSPVRIADSPELAAYRTKW
jgi:hypothetical protein